MESNKTVFNKKMNPRSRSASGDEYAAPAADGVLGVVLAASHSWGECALVNVTARPLWPIAGRPLIEHILSWLGDGGVVGACICGNSDTMSIRQKLRGDAPSNRALRYYEDVMPRGPAGCVRDVADRAQAETFVVVDGTVLPQVDLSAVLRDHLEQGADFTMVAANTQAAGAPGTTPESLTPVGIYVMSRAVAKSVPAGGYQDIKESLIPRLHVGGKRILVHVVDGESAPRVTCPTTYLAVNRCILQRMTREGKAPEGYTSFNGGWVHRTASVDSTVRFAGPVLVGPACEIRAGAMVMGPTSIGRGGIIGRDAVVSRAALWNQCVVGAGAILEHCVIADNTEVEDGVVMRNTVAVPVRREQKGFFSSLASLRRSARGGDAGTRPADLFEDFLSADAGRHGGGSGALAPQA